MSDGPLGFEPGPDDEERARRAPRDARVPDPISGGGRRNGWIAGAVGVLLLVYIGVNFVTHSGTGPGSKGPEVGSQARAFAAPLVTGQLEGAVNIATAAGKGAKTAACDLHLAAAYNICDDWRRRPVAVVFFATPVGGCVRQLDVVQRAHVRHPGVGVVAVAIRGKRRAAARLVRERGLTFPVVFDEDGRLTNLYGVAVCPQITYLRRGGRVAGTNIGQLSDRALDAQLARLEQGARPVLGDR